ncbi:hypothetical protein QC758_16705 [Halomonas campisalis]|uniref:hypothetical protein n=1 Tax=Billgrantia campisalis TaxID=74661 RepID=UPI001EF050E2|nr:hypothetical protein [Halomonas campisalis]MDR5864596.1 hypothetical protein [Halomonas campisalis]
MPRYRYPQIAESDVIPRALFEGRRRLLRQGAALALLVPLAITSFQRVRAAMGNRAWHWLHRLVYVSAGLGVTHLWILTRADYLVPSLYVGVFVVLVLFRLTDVMLVWHSRFTTERRGSLCASIWQCWPVA